MTPLKHHNIGELKLSLIHDTTSDLLAPLHANGRTSFQARHSKNQMPSCFLILILYCFNIPEPKGISGAKNGMAVRTPCFRCLNTMDAIRTLQCDRPRTFPEIELFRTSVLLLAAQPDSLHSSRIACTTRQDNRDAEQDLEVVPISYWSPFLEQGGFRTKAGIPDMSFLFTSNHYTTLVLAFQRCQRNVFLYISLPYLLQQVEKHLNSGLVTSS